MEFTGNEIPTKLHLSKLKEQIRAIAPQAEIRFSEQITWTDIDPQTKTESYRTDPTKIIVSKVPDSITRSQILAILAAHNPTKSDLDEQMGREEIGLERVLLRLLGSASSELKRALKEAAK